jgi:CheY-like chemotaxis protein
MSEEYCVLVADSSPDECHRIGALLRSAYSADVRYANDVNSALEAMRGRLPDVVVADVQLPSGDGPTLIESVRREFPDVPTVVMTASGTEEMAVEALERGAASYVPKAHLDRLLNSTVGRIASASRALRQQLRLRSCWAGTQFEFFLGNDVTLIPPLIAHLQQYVGGMHPHDQTELLRLGIALEEALRNAMHHGNLELSSRQREEDPDGYYREALRRQSEAPYCDRRVFVRATETPEESRYVIRDEGRGFDAAATKKILLGQGLAGRYWGRGLLLMHTFMDEVRFNGAGNEVTMIHRRKQRVEDQKG